MIEFDDVSLSIGGHDIFIGAKWRLNPSEKAGLIGRNGSGKTTLLRAVSKEISVEKGFLRVRSGIRLGYLAQDASLRSSKPLWNECQDSMEHLKNLENMLVRTQERLQAETDPDEIVRLTAKLVEQTELFRMAGGFATDEKIGEVLFGLGFKKNDWDKPCDTFSGGWRVRIALACLLLSEPDLLLLDEPTNHLDYLARSWLAGHLLKSSSTMIIVSHDRHLLRKVCNRVVEIQGAKLLIFKGGFESWIKERAQRITQEEAQYRIQQKEREKLQTFVDRNRAKAHRAAQAQSRQKALDRMEIIDAPVKEKAPPRYILPEPPHSALEVFRLVDAELGWPDASPIFTGLNFSLERGQRIALLGLNGSGKSTLLKTLTKQITLKKGKFRVGEGVRVGVFTQDLAKDLPQDLNGVDYLISVAPMADLQRARSALGALGLSDDYALRPISSLSGGEKARVALACFTLQKFNVLLLDEPTNHLDSVSIEVLAIALSKFEGALLLATHDRFLVEQVATHVGLVFDGKIEIHEGVYSEDFELKDSTTEQIIVSKNESALSHQDRKRKAREEERKRLELEKVQNRIDKIDIEISALDMQMASLSDFSKISPLSQKRITLEKEQAHLFEIWEQLELELNG